MKLLIKKTCIKLWFVDQNCESVETEDFNFDYSVNSIERRDRMYVNVYGFSCKNIGKNVSKNIRGK